MRGWVVVLVVVGCGCNGRFVARDGGPAGGGTTGWSAADGSSIVKDGAAIADDASSVDVALPTLPASCGGTVDLTGWVNDPQQPFTAGYVYASYTLGCGSAQLIIADRQINPNTTLRVFLTAPPGTGTLVGATTPAATISAVPFGPYTVGCDVDVTTAIPPIDGVDAGTPMVAGTLNLQVTSVSLTGAFSTPFCGLVIGCL